MAPQNSLIPAEEQSNYETFRECLSEPVLRILATAPEKPPRRRRGGKKKKCPVKGDAVRIGEEMEQEEDINVAEDLGEFVDYLATELFASLPQPIRNLSYTAFQSTPSLRETYSPPLSPTTLDALIATIPHSASDSLSSYGLLPPHSDTLDLARLLSPVLESYITSATAPPPIWSATRTDFCEICEREWIPTTYHHLIPRSTHSKVLKRGWHNEERLNSVAWLCRACHSFVHRVEPNEELARNWYTVELLRGREDVQIWVKWVGRLRWKKR
ncbi:hypothetical protein K432DRAFT_438711 [Lepidopterella palustris CBS 459.81]|uniref:HNH domain-containing protein n=1 Tax=Lepidopterella palustris CBS 459.81 TaxID=1314670 RepID=A0A8E2JKV3_9PEZI|nr:hypothetical protein K432DRAFT_438711 [Lepidopterella palustris CBS 459.81]